MKRTLLLIIVMLLIGTIPAFAQPSVKDTLKEGINNIIDNNSPTLKEVVGKIDEIVEYTIGKFSDIKETDWFTQTVSKLVGLGVIDGYEDGTFRPQGNIQTDAFIKMTVVALGYDLENGEDYWASAYIEKAKDLELIEEGEFSDYKRQINRGEIARIIVRAIDESYSDDIKEYRELISDYNSIPDGFKDYVLKAYAKGIITGYPDGTFRAENKATRAEASTMLIRMLDESERKVPDKLEIQKRTTELTEEDIERLQSYEVYKLTLDGKVSQNYQSFEDKYKNNRNDCEYVLNNFYPSKFKVEYFDTKKGEEVSEQPPYQRAESNWISSPKLVYDDPVNDSVIRGIIQIKYTSDSNPYGLKANTWYEADAEYFIRFTTDGNYMRKFEHLSEFKEVK